MIEDEYVAQANEKGYIEMNNSDLENVKR